MTSVMCKFSFMKKILLSVLFSFFLTNVIAQNALKSEINTTLDAWHKAAANVDYKKYFDLMTEDAIFIGTDATENWTKPVFQAFAKPYFDKGKAWNFTCMERNIYFNSDKTLAWFDELLDTQMKICRGSGVLIFVNGVWKIKHYVLSMTIPNNVSDDVIKIKSPIEDQLILTLKNKNK